MRVIAMGGPRQTMSRQNLTDLAARFNVTPLASAMALDGWKLADRPAAGGADPAAQRLNRSPAARF